MITTRCFPSLVLGALIGASLAHAGPVFSCQGGTTACNGNLYAVTATNTSGNTWQISVSVEVTNSYTGNQFTDALEAISIGSIANSYDNPSLVSAPSGNWTFETGGLNASGCDGTGNFECAHANTLADAVVLGAAGNIFTWVFQIQDASGVGSADTGCTENPGDLGCLHLKYLYVDTGGNKVGSLGSFDTDIQPGGGGTGQATPEPVPFALVGTAFVVLGVLRRHHTA